MTEFLSIYSQLTASQKVSKSNKRLSPEQLGILCAVALGNSTALSIRSKLGISSAGSTSIIKRLVAHGYLNQGIPGAETKDQRVKILKLTPAGFEVLKSYFPEDKAIGAEDVATPAEAAKKTAKPKPEKKTAKPKPEKTAKPKPGKPKSVKPDAPLAESSLLSATPEQELQLAGV